MLTVSQHRLRRWSNRMGTVIRSDWTTSRLHARHRWTLRLFGGVRRRPDLQRFTRPALLRWRMWCYAGDDFGRGVWRRLAGEDEGVRYELLFDRDVFVRFLSHLFNRLIEWGCRGPAAAPLIGGYSTYASWRWCFAALSILCVFAPLIHSPLINECSTLILLALVYFTVPETYPPLLLRTEARRLRAETGDERITCTMEVEARKAAHLPRSRRIARRAQVIFGRPVVMFCTELILFCVSLYVRCLSCFIVLDVIERTDGLCLWGALSNVLSLSE